ncbi:MAG TPA: PH domain-containing protein [Thermoanaerobaculia bacterium]|nr:PH domain-containing protein [Thermoanaerobaculia bacterium]
MTHTAKQLHPGEEILYVAHPSKIRLVPLVLVALVLIGGAIWLSVSQQDQTTLLISLVVAAIPILILLQQLFVLRANEYVLTNRRVIRQTGIMTRSSTDAYLDKINNIELRRTFWGRILGYGDLEIDTASETGMTSFRMINQPVEFKTAILSASEQVRFRGGVPAVATPTGAERMRQLKALLDDGLITADEYEVKRKALLEQI